jgi:hypothetical protein
MKDVHIRVQSTGIDESRDPSMLEVRPDENNQNTIVVPKLKVFRNMISFDGRSSRSRMGFKSLTDEAFYPAGTTAKVSILAKTSAGTIDGNLILMQGHTRTTATTGTPVAGFLPSTTAVFTPADIGNVVELVSSGATTIINRFVNDSLVEVETDLFTGGAASFYIYRGSGTKGVAYYLIDGVNSIANNTVLEYRGTATDVELTDDDHFFTIMFQDRLFILSGTNRGHVLYKDEVHKLGMKPAWDNNSLGVTDPAGSITGSVKWALCFEDGDTYKLGAPLYIEDSTTDGFYVYANERLELDVGTLPTNTDDTWSHYALYRKMAEWRSFRLAARITKDAALFTGTTTGSQENRLIDSGSAFTEDHVGLTVENEDGETAYVTGREDADTLILDADVMDDGDPWFFGDGAATSLTVNRIVDTNASFTSADVGKKIRTWDYPAAGGIATVTSFISSTELGLDSDIFDDIGDGYVLLGVITSEGSSFIIDTAASFTASDVGKYIQLQDATVSRITAVDTDLSKLTLEADVGSVGDGYDISDGRTTSTLANHLVDNRNTFVAGDVGKAVYNKTGGVATITVLVNSSTVTLNADIFTYTNADAYTTFFGDNRVASVVAVSNPLIESRYTPAGAIKAFVWNNRIFYYGGYSASLSGVTATKDSAIITLSSGQAEDWMIGHNIFISTSGTPGLTPYQIKNVRSTTSIELFTDWLGENVSGGSAKVVADQNEIWPGFQTFADCELTHPLMKIEVDKFDGDQIMHVDVVNGSPVVLKRNSVHALRITSMNDPTGNEIPDVFYKTVDLRCKDGCVGYRAATMDSKGVLYWFSATGGVMAFSGQSPKSMSGASMRDYFLKLDEDLFWEATMVYNESTSEIILGNLTKSGVGNYAIAMSTTTGNWREITEVDMDSVGLVAVKR